MIIDGHCHVGKGDGLTGPWDTAADLGSYLRRARAAGITRTVLLPIFHSDYHRANAQVARAVARDPERFIGFAGVHAARDAGRIDHMIAHAVRAWGLRGIKVHAHDAPCSREICEAAQRFGIPIVYDVLSKAPQVDLLAAEYPRVNFIIPHLGSFVDDWRAQQQVVDQMARWPNVYGDTSGVRRFDYIVQAAQRAGPQKLIFGSDGPWLHPGLELHKIRLLGLAPAEEALVLGGNMLRLLEHSRRVADEGSLQPQAA